MLGIDPADADRDWRQRVGFVLQECRLTPELTVSEAVAQYAGYYAAPRDVDETVALVGLEQKADARTSQPLGRAAAAARRRAGARRRPRAALPRRADHRLRPLRPPPGLAGDREPARARQDRLPHHPLHGRGPGARGPGRDHRPRAGSWPRAAPDELGEREQRPTEISFRLPAGVRARHDAGLGLEPGADRRAGRDAERPRPRSGAARPHHLGERDAVSSSRGSRCDGRASRTSTSSSPTPPRTTRPRPDDGPAPRCSTSSATTRRSSGAIPRRSSSR